jgi:aldehyde dehydrogenase (NAD+)
MAKQFENLVDGRWTPSAESTPNINPSDLSDVIGDYASADAATTAEAVEAARRAFPGWSNATPQKRSDILHAASNAIERSADELAHLLAREEGKTLAEARGEVIRAANIFRYFAGEAVRLSGEAIASVRPSVDVEVRREPVGVVAIITPWNFPIAIPAWKIAPALAFGNTVVFKPSELTPGCAWALAKILFDVELPAGVLNLVIGTGANVGAPLTQSGDVDAISFTGSVLTGQRIAASAKTKRVQLEMGGKNPLVILDDADLDLAVSAAVDGAFLSSGQRCTASSRLIVTRGVEDEFIDRLEAARRKLRVGNALAPDTQVGPVASEAQFERVQSYIGVARDEGAGISGGKVVEAATRGYFLEPTLLTGARPDMKTSQEEIFGPVASVISVGDLDEAIAVANGVEFGLSAGIFTRSLSASRQFIRRAQVGMVMVNLATAGIDYHVPFGGIKNSSAGPKEQGSAAKEFYTRTKTAYVFA